MEAGIVRGRIADGGNSCERSFVSNESDVKTKLAMILEMLGGNRH